MKFLTRTLKTEEPAHRDTRSECACSNNLNQYAKVANTYGTVYQADIQDLQERLGALWGNSREILMRLSSLT